MKKFLFILLSLTLASASFSEEKVLRCDSERRTAAYIYHNESDPTYIGWKYQSSWDVTGGTSATVYKAMGSMEFNITSLAEVLDGDPLNSVILRVYGNSDINVGTSIYAIDDTASLTGVITDDVEAGLIPNSTEALGALLHTMTDTVASATPVEFDITAYALKAYNNGDNFLGFTIWSETALSSIITQFDYDDTTMRLILNREPIPEPSTYAAIFGALALGFAAYSRRK